MKIEKKLHELKEQLLGNLLFRRKETRLINLFLSGILVFFVIGAFLLCTGFAIVSQFFWATAVFLLCVGFVCVLCKWGWAQRGISKNIIFLIIFCFGVISYIKLANSNANQNPPAHPECKQVVIEKSGVYVSFCEHEISSQKQSGKIQEAKKGDFFQTLFTSAHHGYTSLAAFFPSRGGYEINHDGSFDKNHLDKTALLLYISFHAFVYIFASYFLISLWGYRTINRLRFWLTRDEEKNVFWCITPEPKMLHLAKDIISASDGINSSQIVFSVDEQAIDDPKKYFQEMNFQKFSLKLRKPGQIHEKCLRAAKHFFLSEDYDWNIDMAQALLNKRENINTPTKIYIKISNDARKKYYLRWADQYSNKNNVEVIFIDECALIAGKFIQSHHLLKDMKSKINHAGAVVDKEDGFNILLIGFGGLGREILCQLVCDSRFLSPDGTILNFHADIIDSDSNKLSLFRKQFASMCDNTELRLKFDFHKLCAGSGEFYEFLEKNLLSRGKNYDRIIIALGNAALNIETAAEIEDIIRKNINLPGYNPAAELLKWKEKIFLISPEINSAFLNKIQMDTQQNASHNLFTLIGADNEIYNFADIINEKMFIIAKLLNYRYNKAKKDIDWQKINTPAVRKEIEGYWCKANMYNRQSSYAAALGLENIRLLLDCRNWTAEEFRSKAKKAIAVKERLCEIEHLRWWAFMLGQGYITWQNPSQLKKAKQVDLYMRHATMIPYDKLPEMDKIFPEEAAKKKFQQKDWEIIKSLPYLFKAAESNGSDI